MNYILEMKNITKVYPNVIANSDVDFSLREGEIHALMGENGAGKSTLMKILFGEEKADTGTILLKGKEVQIDSPMKAIQLGIGMVHQHFMLADNLTVTENVILGDEPLSKGIINYRKAQKIVREACEKYHFKLNPNEKVGNLSISAKQKVEILKALVRGTKILIMDEPTAVLAPQETEELFQELLKLKEDGYTIVFISHKLGEIKHICDRMTILRRGEVSGIADVREVTTEEISRTMVGRVVSGSDLRRKKMPVGEPILTIKDVTIANKKEKERIKQINLQIRCGEILGLAGVEGNGQSELVEAIGGMRKITTGEIRLGDKNIENLPVAKVRKSGLAHIPEDRMVHGSAKEVSIAENLLTTRFRDKKFGKYLLQKSKIEQYAETLIAEYQIKTDSAQTKIGNLSGGNIQKVVVAREIAEEPDMLISNQPTRGIDIGAAMFIRQRLLDLRDEGKGIFLLSADISELFQLSDKIAVIYDGEITAYFPDPAQVDEEILGWYMLGVKRMTAEEIMGVTG